MGRDSNGRTKSNASPAPERGRSRKDREEEAEKTASRQVSLNQLLMKCTPISNTISCN